jgi:DNA polymerase III alpha subunit (gram-positive type)
MSCAITAIMTKEVYFSIDIETDGPCPGLNSMLSLGVVALCPVRGELGFFEDNLKLLPEANPNPKTMSEFWSQWPQQYAATRVNVQDPADVFLRFDQWVNSFDGVPVAVAFPAGFDFSWIWYYSNRFVGNCAFSFSCIDLKTLAWSILGGNYRHATKRRWPGHWFSSKLNHTHVAIEDAREQGVLFLNMLKDLEHKQITLGVKS